MSMSEAVVNSYSITRKPGAFEKRIHEIDFARGILIALVIMDHLFNWFAQDGTFDWAWADYYWTCMGREVVRLVVLFLFVFISGISTAFSRNNWKRAGELLVFSAIIYVGSSILTLFFQDQMGFPFRIDFNIIGVLGWSTLFYCFTQGRSWRILVVGLLITLLLAWYLIPYLDAYFIAHGMTHLNIPELFDPGWGYADWLPLFPYIFFFFLGACFSYLFYLPNKESLIKHRGNWERPVCFMGRHSLLFYFGHQAIFVPIFLLIGYLLHK